MRLKPQPRPARATARRGRPRGAHRVGPRPKGRQARRPGVSLRRRMAGRLPSIRRLLAAVAAVAALAGLVALIDGPWLRISAVSWSGGTYTRGDVVEGLLDEARGQSVLAVDTRALRASIEEASYGAAVRCDGCLPHSSIETLLAPIEPILPCSFSRSSARIVSSIGVVGSCQWVM